MENNTFNIFKIVILGIIAVVLTSILVAILNGNTNFEGITIKGNNKLIYDKSFKDEINKINVNTNDNDIKIQESTDEKISVKIYDLDGVEPEVYVEDNTLIINNKKEKKIIGIFGINNSPKIVLSIPKDKIYDLNVDGSSSDIQSKLDLGNVNITTNSGDIDLKNTKNINIVSTSGDITLGKVEEIKLQTTSGDIYIDEIKEKIELETTSGDIKINKLNLNSNSKIKAISGDIVISKTNDIYIDTTTTSGDTKIKNNNRQAKYELKIKTTSGDIIVNN